MTCSSYDDDEEALDFREAVLTTQPASGFGRLHQKLLAWSRDPAAAPEALNAIDALFEAVASGRRVLQDTQSFGAMHREEQVTLQQADRSAEMLQTILRTLRDCVESGDALGALRFLADAGSEMAAFERMMSDLEP